MRKTSNAENSRLSDFAFGSAPEYAPLEATAASLAAETSAKIETEVLDKFVTLIKFVFLYVPGVAAVHLIMMGFALARLYDHWAVEMLAGSAGIAIVGAFMMVLGIGKLSDLRYLKVVGTVAAVSAVSAILYSILAVTVPGDYFGLFAKISLPFTLLAGYLVKRDIDSI